MSTKNLQTTEEENEQDTVPAEPSTEWISGAMEEGCFHVPDEIRDREIFIAYKLEFDENREKWKKVPKKPTPKGCYNTDPTSADDAVTFSEAMDTVNMSKARRDEEYALDGVGIVIEGESDLVGVDLDDCFDADSGDIMEYALQIIFALPSFVEVSPSGTGLHIIIYAPDGLLDRFRNKVDVGEDGKAGLEIYDEHFFTVSGRTLKGTTKSVENCGSAVRDIQRAWMGLGAGSSSSNGRTPSGTYRGESDRLGYNPEPYGGDSYEMTEEDWELVEKACDMSDRFEAFFGGTAEYTNRSDAEFEFFCKLAWFTQNCYGKYNASDIDAMERIARESELSRSKFDDIVRDQVTYLRYSLAKAIRENGRRRKN